MGVFNVRDLEVMQMGLQNELNELEEDYANGKNDAKCEPRAPAYVHHVFCAVELRHECRRPAGKAENKPPVNKKELY